MEHKITIRPQYNEVDQMGYVYHANFVNYCHRARTELMRLMGICDATIEEKGFLLPVIEMELKYIKPSYYDVELSVTAELVLPPSNRLTFNFIFENEQKEVVCRASSTVVFVNKSNRKPCRMPTFVSQAFQDHGHAPDLTFDDLLVAFV